MAGRFRIGLSRNNALSTENDSNKARLRSFGLSTGGMLMFLFGAVLPWLMHRPYPLWPWILGSVLATLGIVAPRFLFYPFRIWMAFGALMGEINSRLVLLVLFFAVFFPMGLMLRLFGWDPLRRRVHAHEPSYRLPSQPIEPERMERPY